MDSRMDAANIALTLTGALLFAGVYLMSAATDRLTASVASLTDSVDQAITLLTADPNGDTAAVTAAADAIDAATSKIQAAITAPAA